MSVTEHPQAPWRPAAEGEEPTATAVVLPGPVPGRGAAAVSGATATVAASSTIARRSPWWIELLAVGWLIVLYDWVTSLAPLRLHEAVVHGQDILSFERSLHLDPELALNHWLAAHHTLGIVLSYYYDNAHFVVTLGLLGWLWWRRPDLYRPLRNSLVLINVIGFVVFWRLPVAPPRLLPGSAFTDIVAASHTFGSWHTGKLASEADQLAAMPSLHLAWASWSALAMWRLSRRWYWRTLAVLYPIVTAVGVLTTGNHYLADVLAGVATTVLSVAIVELGVPRWREWAGQWRTSRRSVRVE